MNEPVTTIAVFKKDDENSECKVLIIKRKYDPEKGAWALPGGHVDEGEETIDAAYRELKEETDIVPDKLIHICTEKTGHGTEDSLYACEIENDIPAHSGSDATNARWVTLDQLPKLAFTHNDFVLRAHNKLFGVKETIYQLTDYKPLLLEEIEQSPKGCIIAFEGIDCAGKSTQHHRLEKWLDKHNVKHMTTKWNSSEVVRDAIKHAKELKTLTPMLYCLLHAADMLYRYENIIQPALEDVKVIICDRYIYTSYIRDKVRKINTEILDQIYKDIRRPNILFHCKVPIEIAFERFRDDDNANYYNTGQDVKLAEDWKDSCLKYFKLMDSEYSKLLPKEKGYVALNMDRPPEKIFKEVKNCVRKFLMEKNLIECNTPELISTMVSENIFHNAGLQT